MSDFRAPTDQAIADIAIGQHGVVSTAQLRLLGIDKHAIHKRVQAGRLHRLHHGVYAVGHRAPSREREWMAAVLACGKGAAISHGSAAALWGLLRPIGGPIDVSIPTHTGRGRRRGIRLHRCTSLRAGQVTEHRGIPATTPARTIADIDGVLPPYLVRRATRQAEIFRFQLDVETDRTRSDLERDFLQLCRRHGVPPPEVNVKIGPWTVDFLWRGERLAVEADFYDYHRGRVAFQDDRARELDLRRRGFDVRRFSELQVNEQPAEIAADLRDALGLAS
ncbi:MAG TPA: type IV toxin-antitoxin system AbiEi family antitoxin domain-containing protein [Solirubrobacterales bacterium]|nr:type IV toxin-antitoxin system AbiEi family antitoxin domain-containing protein [Solirubrobacterales bacterium]